MDWEKIKKLSATEQKNLSAIERKLFLQDFCTNEELQKELDVTSEKRVQDYIKMLRLCYRNLETGDSDNNISRGPHYALAKRDMAHLAFPEMVLGNEERKQLHNIFKLAAVFEGAIPLKSILETTGCMDKEINKILKEYSKGIDVQLKADLARLISNIYTAISEKKVISFKWSKLNDNYATNDGVLHVAPYYIKKFEGNWYLLGCIRNSPLKNWVDFPWSVFPLQRILDENPTGNPIWQCQKPDIHYREIDVNRILHYYSNVIGFNVPTVPGEKFKETLDVKDIIIKVPSYKRTRLKEYPIHQSQKYNPEDGTISIHVIENNELYSRLMSYGKDIEVLAPQEVRNKLRKKLAEALKRYTI